MGLFDFAADLGKKLFGNDDDPAEKIREHITEDNPGVEDLKVEVQDGVASLSGKAKDQSAFEKIVLMAGNVLGIKEVQADGLDMAEPPVEEARVEYYTIQKGDTLWAIAKQYLGNGNKYHVIFEANREVIKDPDLIYPGQKIRIPLD
jgi:nucleoid-associated protein YgaU